jgi:multidrug efflux pump subunit AcrA (membrane-fusion protein)
LRGIRAVFVLVVAIAGGCSRSGDSQSPAEEASVQSVNGTPATVARVERATLADEIDAPGQTIALVEQQVRAPFSGVLTALDVVEGDRVKRSQSIGTLVARDSEAALSGAEEMVRSASTPQQKADAERAVELAHSHLIRSPLLAAVSGVVIRRMATAGDRVAEDQELVTIAADDSMVFRANVAQSELVRVRPGQQAAIDLPGMREPLAGITHGLLTGSNSGDLTAPVRIDFSRRPGLLTAGLFGTARITVAEHRDVAVVPVPAVLRDDVSGVSRIATVGDDRRLHWVPVETGLRVGDRVELVAPQIAPGVLVVTSGQIGLEEGTLLAIDR